MSRFLILIFSLFITAVTFAEGKVVLNDAKKIEEFDLAGNLFFLIDKELKEFSNILGGCERIRNTPIPYSYSMFIKKFIFTFTITLPFAFITEFHYMTIPIVLMVFFILVSVELVAEEIEDPFGNDVNDLPTTELSKKIKNNVNLQQSPIYRGC